MKMVKYQALCRVLLTCVSSSGTNGKVAGTSGAEYLRLRLIKWAMEDPVPGEGVAVPSVEGWSGLPSTQSSFVGFFRKTESLRFFLLLAER